MGCALSEAENFVLLKLKSCNISANLDQAMSKKKKKKKKKREKTGGGKKEK